MTDDPVRRQYEQLPYPPRDPADEAKRLITGSPSHLLEVDHYIFAGKREAAAPFRGLVAGGGTGDATMMLAQQLADAGADASLVHLDISEASLETARARGRVRGVRNIEFVQGSLMDAAGLAPGPFDYIDCCGVLHHLEDPLAGLQALTGVLAPGGGIGMMLYAPLGRTGVYPAQGMLRMLGAGAPMADRLDMARRLLDSLPDTNWLKRNPFMADHKTLGDAGLYDLLLHERDVAFTVFQIAELVTRAGLRLVTFIDPLRYEPTVYLRDERLLARLADLPLLERCVFAEMLCGNMKSHIFYAVHAGNDGVTVANPDSPDLVPVPRDMDGASLAGKIGAGGAINVDMDGIPLSFRMPPLAGPIVSLIDGTRSIGDIHGEITTSHAPGTDGPTFERQFGHVYRLLSGLGRLFLRAPANG